MGAVTRRTPEERASGLLLQNDVAAPNAAAISVMPQPAELVVEETSTEVPATITGRKWATKDLAKSVFDELVSQQEEKYKRKLVHLNARVDEFILEALIAAEQDLTNRKVAFTRQGLVALCMVKALNISTPQGWDPMEG
jgi:hypothetical protein